MSTGWNKLGQAFGGFDTSEAEEQGALGVARVESALMKARKQRDELNALEELGTEIGDMVGDEDAGRQIATILRAGKNPEQVTGARLDMQRYGLTNEAATAGREGELDLMNVLLSAGAGKPMVRNKVEGNTIIDPFQADARPRTTDIGEAMAGAYDARAEAALRPRTPSAGRASKAPEVQLQEQLVKEVISRYSKLMARDGADVQLLMSQRDKELAKLGAGPDIAPGTDPGTRAGLAAANALPPGASEADAAAAFAGAAGPGVTTEQVEARKSIQGKMYVKINGEWFEE